MKFCTYVRVQYSNNIFLQDAEWSPLLLASYGNHTDVLKLLIQHGVQLDIGNKVH